MKSCGTTLAVVACKSAAAFMLSIVLTATTVCAIESSLNPESAKAKSAPIDKPEIVQPGDTADIGFICRLNDGEVAASTDNGLVKQIKKSGIFVPKEKDGPVSVTVVERAARNVKEKSFEEEISDRIAGAMTGMKAGDSRKLELTAETPTSRSPEEYIINISRTRLRPKEIRMAPEVYKTRTGKPPVVGQPFSLDPALPGHIESVTDKEVVIRFKGNPGAVVNTPFGPGRILEDEKNYKLEISAAKGALVRSGGFIGRITDINEKYITIDYRNPFGYETLHCDVRIEKVAKAKAAENARAE